MKKQPDACPRSNVFAADGLSQIQSPVNIYNAFCFLTNFIAPPENASTSLPRVAQVSPPFLRNKESFKHSLALHSCFSTSLPLPQNRESTAFPAHNENNSEEPIYPSVRIPRKLREISVSLFYTLKTMLLSMDSTYTYMARTFAALLQIVQQRGGSKEKSMMVIRNTSTRY